MYSVTGNEGIDFLQQIYVTTLEMNVGSLVGIATADRQEDPTFDCLAHPVAERSKAWVCGRTLAGVAGSSPAGGMKEIKPGQSR